MPRYRLLVEYDGGPFRGWQRQMGEPTIQEALERACAKLTPERPEVIGAGRTDAGVHATGQVAHVDLARDLQPGRLMAALNAHLRPAPIVILAAGLAPPGFHARFSALRRHYLYRILNRRAPPAVEAGRVWHIARPLDAELMHVAAQALVGRHDFTSFRASECQADTAVKTLERITVRRVDELIEIRSSARSFLHHQMRNMVGTLRLVGERRVPVGHIAGVLAKRDRSAAGQTAPATGLFLIAVDY